MRHWLIVDVATAALPDAETYLEGTVRAPKNYGPEAAAKAIAEKTAERTASAALDMDLARITGIGLMLSGEASAVYLCREEADELYVLRLVAKELFNNPTIVTFGGFNFDLPLLMRRARYLGVNFPTIHLDRFKSPHLDLCELLSDRNPQRRRSLEFYAKRLGMGITKTLSGAEEARVPETGRWDDLRDSLEHDITAAYRLATWMGVIRDEAEAVGF